jgi:hypothetical protein
MLIWQEIESAGNYSKLAWRYNYVFGREISERKPRKGRRD